MDAVLGTPLRALSAGLALTLLLLVIWLAFAASDALGAVSLVLRYAHVLGAMVWVGLIAFVNFIQFRALQEADDGGRAAVLRWIVPYVAKGFRHASHLTLISGLLLLVATGYLLDQWVYTSGVYIPALRNALLWAGAAAGLLMWALVHFAIWPSLRIVLGEVPGDAALKTKARERVRLCARLNLLLTPPVVFAMIAAAHGY